MDQINSILKGCFPRGTVIFFLAMILPVVLHADYSTDFNSTTGYVTGGLTGQDQWTNISGAAGVFEVVPNDGTLNNVNPTGGDLMVRSTSTPPPSGTAIADLPASSRFSRSVPVVGNVISASFDINLSGLPVNSYVNANGTNQPLSMLAFSINDVTSARLFSINATQGALLNITQGKWQLSFGSTTNGIRLLTDLTPNVWYNVSFQVDFSTGTVLSLKVQCIDGQFACTLFHGGAVDVAQIAAPVSIGSIGTPDRIFLSQNSAIFETALYDNINVMSLAVPEPGTYLTMATFLVLGLAIAKKRKVRAR